LVVRTDHKLVAKPEPRLTGYTTMKRRITRVAPLQTGKMLGILYTGMGLIFLPFFMLAAAAGAFAPHGQATSSAAPPAAAIAGIIMGMGTLMPFIYGAMGFFVGVIGAAFYNLIARWIGGFEVEVE
jgi:hypothetical protein